MSIFFFLGKIHKKYSAGNEEWIKSEIATITSDYVLPHKNTPQARLNKSLCTQALTSSSTHSSQETTVTIQGNGTIQYNTIQYNVLYFERVDT